MWGGHARRDINKDVTAVVQADMLVAWTRVVAVRLKKGFEICFGRRLDRT